MVNKDLSEQSSEERLDKSKREIKNKAGKVIKVIRAKPHQERPSVNQRKRSFWREW